VGSDLAVKIKRAEKWGVNDSFFSLGNKILKKMSISANQENRVINLVRKACIFLNERVYLSLFYQLSNMKMGSYLWIIEKFYTITLVEKQKININAKAIDIN
jgi:hypothetical protein